MAYPYFKIEATNRAHPIAVVSPSDFMLSEAGEVSTRELLEDPQFSLYCFDHETRNAIFVRVKDALAVDQGVFYYQSQAEDAIGIVSVPFPNFHSIAEQLDWPTQGIIFIHSVGRCGSTLLSKAFQAIPEVHSLSEPDDLTQLTQIRQLGQFSESEFKQLFISAIRWRCKPRASGPYTFLALKTRAEVMVLADLFASEFPAAKHMFLYRDAVSWMQSNFRSFPPDRNVYDPELNHKMEEGWSTLVPLVRQKIRPDLPMNPVQIRTLGWVTSMEGYLDLLAMGTPAIAARFDDLTTYPTRVIKELLDFCRLTSVDWPRITTVLSKDSQAGTIFDREDRKKSTMVLSEALTQDIHEIVGQRPRLLRSDVLLPHTISISPEAA